MLGKHLVWVQLPVPAPNESQSSKAMNLPLKQGTAGSIPAWLTSARVTVMANLLALEASVWEFDSPLAHQIGLVV